MTETGQYDILLLGVRGNRLQDVTGTFKTGSAALFLDFSNRNRADGDTINQEE